MKYKILISTYAGCSNKGTEALLRGLVSILEESMDSDRIELSLASIQPQLDCKAGLPLFQHFYQRYTSNLHGLKRKILCRLSRYATKLGLKDTSFYLLHYDFLNAVKRQDLFIEMGADNYDVEYGEGYKWMYQLHQWIRKHSKTKMLLYDCSLNSNSVTPDFIKEIERFDITTIRESESWNNLSKLYNGNRVHFCPDPAFVMEPEETELPSA